MLRNRKSQIKEISDKKWIDVVLWKSSLQLLVVRHRWRVNEKRETAPILPKNVPHNELLSAASPWLRDTQDESRFQLRLVRGNLAYANWKSVRTEIEICARWRRSKSCRLCAFQGLIDGERRGKKAACPRKKTCEAHARATRITQGHESPLGR